MSYETAQRAKMVNCAGCGCLTFPGRRCVRCSHPNDAGRPFKCAGGEAIFETAAARNAHDKAKHEGRE